MIDLRVIRSSKFSKARASGFARGLAGPVGLGFLLLLFEMAAGHGWGMAVTAPCLLFLTVLYGFFAPAWSGILTATLGWVYVAFILPKHIPSLTAHEIIGRRFIWFGLMVILSSITYYLRHRSEMRLHHQINETHAAAESLRMSEERTRAVIEFAYDAFVGMDQAGLVTEWNRQAETMFGWAKQDVVGKMLSDVLIPERMREAHRRGLAHFLKTGEGPVMNKRIEVTAMHRLGHEVPIELTIYPIVQHGVVVFGSFLQDITEKKRVARIQSAQFGVGEILTRAEALQTAFPELLKLLGQNFGWQVGEVWLTSSDRIKRAFRWQEAGEKSVTLDRADQRLSELNYEASAMAQAFSSKKPACGFNTDLTKKIFVVPLLASVDEVVGLLHFETSTLTDLDSSVVAVMREIGQYIGLFVQRKRSDERLAALYQDLEIKVSERTSELAAAFEQAKVANRLKDEFLATVSHELRTPLGVIIGHSDLLLEDDGSPEEKRQSLETIGRNAKVQMQIIGDLLDVSRIITGKMQLELARVDLDASVRAAVDSIRIAASMKEIRVETDLDPNVKPVMADADRIQQVLWNLLSNAVKFTPQGGTIRIRLVSRGPRAVLEVSDSGKGIEPSFLPHVFERFRQEDASTTRKYGGLGLGLAIVRHIIEAHGGTVSVASDGINCGTTFTIEIPVLNANRRLDSSDTPIARALGGALGGLRVMVVDDEPDTLAMIGLILRRAGAMVELKSSAVDAIRGMKEWHPQVLVSDISMPDQDGFDLITQVRHSSELGREVFAIALTAHARKEEIDRALKAGFNLHLAKPVAAQELIRQIAQAVAHRPDETPEQPLH